MKNLNRILVASILAFSLSSCGNNDPLELFDQPLPELSSITQQAGGSYTLVTPYTPSTPYWGVNSFSGSLFAPARGYVAEIGLDTERGTNSYFVKIIHSGRMFTKVIGITQIVLPRVGDYVIAGQQIGTFYGGLVYFQVVVDNKSVCPLSYMTDTFRSTFYTGVGGNPCR